MFITSDRKYFQKSSMLGMIFQINLYIVFVSTWAIDWRQSLQYILKWEDVKKKRQLCEL